MSDERYLVQFENGSMDITDRVVTWHLQRLLLTILEDKKIAGNFSEMDEAELDAAIDVKEQLVFSLEDELSALGYEEND